MNGYPKGKGIEDFGNFNEGFCFKLNQTFPLRQIFVICAADMVNKFILLFILLSFRKPK